MHASCRSCDAAARRRSGATADGTKTRSPGPRGGRSRANAEAGGVPAFADCRSSLPARIELTVCYVLERGPVIPGRKPMPDRAVRVRLPPRVARRRGWPDHLAGAVVRVTIRCSTGSGRSVALVPRASSHSVVSGHDGPSSPVRDDGRPTGTVEPLLAIDGSVPFVELERSAGHREVFEDELQTTPELRREFGRISILRGLCRQRALQLQKRRRPGRQHAGCTCPSTPSRWLRGMRLSGTGSCPWSISARSFFRNSSPAPRHSFPVRVARWQ
jgi:hypothetical protein